MAFTKEADFESALIKILSEHGWEKEILHNCTEQQLIQNWKDILFQNNPDIDHLNDYPLTDSEMQQILEQIAALRTPLKLNGFIKGMKVSIKRDNPDDAQHFGKEISLKIYDPREIAGGQTRYQIVQQPRFPGKSKLLSDRRGDLMLLINGMPMIHIELKRTGIEVQKACEQIRKYAAEGVFTGLFSLIQIFVAMTPEETLYFANPGPDGKFNPNYFFHWADFNNEPINDWKEIASTLLSIPMAHQLIGFYTVADETDGILKVMRSYQYYAVNKISDKVAKTKWEADGQRGGFIWHTTGSGKTMTSFKSAQLISASKDADKVIFLVDRIELGTQSLKEYQGFADQREDVQATENTHVLISKLTSPDPANTLIVTSIQKMSNIRDDSEGALKAADLALIQSKRIVFIVDECHRSVFGENMMPRIKQTFPRAIFFGFSGTPIQDENQKKGSITSTIFGDELHRYSIADGIRDKNVLGFDPYKVLTYKDADLRQNIALEKAKAKTAQEAMADPQKSEIYYKYMHLPMAGSYDAAGTYQKGIEDFIPTSQYERETHRNIVVQDIKDNWLTLSHSGKFHALFATSSIPEAVQYYRLIKSAIPELKVTVLFDPTIDNNGNGIEKETGLAEIIDDYNKRYGQDFGIPSFSRMKKDICARLAHKRPYLRIEQSPELQIDLLIVVDQMLTGFDSKWINTLYLDKVLQYENIIQAFSRTNRLFGPEKPFGTIRYYRRPHTMERLIAEAVKLYSGDKPLGLFAERLDKNLEGMNFVFSQIRDLFCQSGIENFAQLPGEMIERKKFAELFQKFNEYLEAATVQGFTWKKLVYDHFTDPETGRKYQIELELDEVTYKILTLRYKELFLAGGNTDGTDDLPYAVDGYLIAIDTGKIDVDYMNSRFDKYLKLLRQENAEAEAIKQAENELHKTFASLTQEEQKFANIFLHDIQSGDVLPAEGKTFRDYITLYLSKAKDDQVHRLAALLGVYEEKLRAMMEAHVTEENINEYGRFDALKATADKEKAKKYFETIEGKSIIPPKIPMKIDKLLRDFILQGGFDIDLPENSA
ncbi:MAG: HsdR family type I site-specific deoxyribonuclease [Roseburia sp.]|nr:HsdR family type I site-specific deoxyribonuclease [Roseburia sp.]MCM1099473.1 HsdR family type I site-specific deoxyribonuclease [Ruminococcus flavefaciens]